tara:strand:+ start:8559 stop:9026 length:468 start_codon:yes stop_codon:yes gene_type:complete
MYYVSLDKDLNKDGQKDNMLLKYDSKGKDFIVGLPIKNTHKVCECFFKSKPNIPQNAYYVVSKKDLNGDKKKDYVVGVFKNNGDLLVLLPLDIEKIKKKEGGATIKQKNPENQKNQVFIQNNTGFLQATKLGAGDHLGRIMMVGVTDALANAFVD